MARMPFGEPRSVPDPAGELYDRKMAELRGQREAEDRGEGSPLAALGHAWREFRDGPRIPRPNTAESFIPIAGPAWQAVGDLQDRDYGSAALNGVFAVADALPVGPLVKGARYASKGVGVLKTGRVTAEAARKILRRRGLAGEGEEIHHSWPLNGIARNVEDPRNHYAFLKVLPTEQHRRLTGSWGGKPMYDPIRRIWYGTTDWMKALPTAVAGYAGDAMENLNRHGGDDAPPLSR